jgi:hypothetical protein
MSHNMIGYDIYDRFTVEHFPLCQKDDFDDHFFFGWRPIQYLNKYIFPLYLKWLSKTFQ